jgi:flavin reductase (DIM6/NTAB) family NADH-FMN oxidoreductase RutF
MTTAVSPVSTHDFVQAMGQHVASVCVITTRYVDERYGLTATAVSSVCADPPRLLVCVNKSGQTHHKIIASGHFGLNVLGESQEKVGRAFAGMMGRDFDRFSIGDWQVLQTGSPILKGAASAFDCRITETIDQFTQRGRRSTGLCRTQVSHLAQSDSCSNGGWHGIATLLRGAALAT